MIGSLDCVGGVGMPRKKEPSEAQLKAAAKARKVLARKREKNKIKTTKKHHYGKRI